MALLYDVPLVIWGEDIAFEFGGEQNEESTANALNINENDLISALERKDIAGAALDVFSTEPINSKNKLFDFGNVLLSPHISGNFSSYQELMMRQFSDMLIKYINNKALKNRVCKKRLY